MILQSFETLPKSEYVSQMRTHCLCVGGFMRCSIDVLPHELSLHVCGQIANLHN
jgi:hypothetical protein